jgi:hypothetical protein
MFINLGSPELSSDTSAQWSLGFAQKQHGSFQNRHSFQNIAVFAAGDFAIAALKFASFM